MNKIYKLFLETKYGYLLAIILFDSLFVSSVVFWIIDEVVLSIIFGCCFILLLYKTFFTFSDIIKFCVDIKRRIWNKYILVWWYGREIPDDEFSMTLGLPTRNDGHE